MTSTANLTPACGEHDHRSCGYLIDLIPGLVAYCQCVCHQAAVHQVLEADRRNRQLFPEKRKESQESSAWPASATPAGSCIATPETAVAP